MSHGTGAVIYFDVDDDQFIRALRETEEDIDTLVGWVALDAAHELESEGGRFAKSLGDDWEISGIGSNSRHIAAPVYWAHMVAGGTKDHGPRSAPLMFFEIDGDLVPAAAVRGMPATHFDEIALARTKSHMPELLRRIVG